MFWRKKKDTRTSVVETTNILKQHNDATRRAFRTYTLRNSAVRLNSVDQERAWHYLAGLGMPYKGETHPLDCTLVCNQFDAYADFFCDGEYDVTFRYEKPKSK